MSRISLVAFVALALLPACKGSTDGAAAAEAQKERVIPVVTATVDRKDVPIFLEGLGNVIAYKTVTVHTQVDGRLDKVLFTEGQKVKRGEAVAQIDPRPFQIQLHQAEGALARDSSQLQDNKINFERFQTLRDQKLVSQQQVDDARAAMGNFAGSIEIDKAQIEQARLNLEYARITSPIDGVTGVRLVDPGNIVHPADATGIVVITQLDPIAVLFTLPEDNLPAVMDELTQRPLKVEAWSRDGAKQLAEGTVQLIDNAINQATATMRMKALFKNDPLKLWPNQFVKTRLLLTTRQNALVVPATAIQRGPKGVFVYVVDPKNQTAQMQTVEIDLTQGEQAIIRKGLKAGDVVVTDGQNQLRPGAKVQTRAPSPSQKS
jgi:multidrug efflux system membrane fusion protein